MNCKITVLNQEDELPKVILGNGIAKKLNLSIKTIDTHKENIKAKLHCASSAELRQMAIEWTNNV